MMIEKERRFHYLDEQEQSIFAVKSKNITCLKIKNIYSSFLIILSTQRKKWTQLVDMKNL